MTPAAVCSLFVLHNANVVGEHVDATVGGRASLDHCGDVGSFVGVGAMRHGVAALAFDDGRGLFGGGWIDVSAEHACALPKNNYGKILKTELDTQTRN